MTRSAGRGARYISCAGEDVCPRRSRPRWKAFPPILRFSGRTCGSAPLSRSAMQIYTSRLLASISCLSERADPPRPRTGVGRRILQRRRIADPGSCRCSSPGPVLRAHPAGRASGTRRRRPTHVPRPGQADVAVQAGGAGVWNRRGSTSSERAWEGIPRRERETRTVSSPEPQAPRKSNPPTGSGTSQPGACLSFGAVIGQPGRM